MSATAQETTVIGTRRLRREDPALLSGEARFIDDLDVPGALWMAAVRSPHAHARIAGVDLSGALESPGVVAAYSGADFAATGAGPLPCAWPVTDDMKNPPHHAIATDMVAHVGQIVAVVLAESRYAAADATEEVIVDYEPLEAVVDLEDAAADRVVIHPDLGTNVSYVWELQPDEEAVDAAFAAAAHTVAERYVQQRLIPAAIEPRGVVVVPAPHAGDVTVYSATQIPHILKVMLALTLGLPEHKVRVVAPSVGGGFGSKLNVYAEEVICCALAVARGTPVRWTEGRSEAAVATIQGRGQIQDISLAADADGKVTAVRASLLADMGAYLQLVTPGIPLLGAFLYHGCYDIPAYSFRCTSVFTNKTPTDAYRGAGRPEATYAIERAMDALAVEVGVTPEEIRRRNFIAEFPYDSSAGLSFDSGAYTPALAKAMELVGYDDLRAEQARRRAASGGSGGGSGSASGSSSGSASGGGDGGGGEASGSGGGEAGEGGGSSSGGERLLGVGFSSYVEMCGLAPSRVLAALKYAAGGWESATVRVLPTAKVQVVTGTSPHGQAHETCWSMIVAERLGVDPDDVDVLHSDTAIAPLGLDTYGSRSLAVGGTAIHMAAEKIIAKARTIAAHHLEASEDDLDYAAGTFTVRGMPGAPGASIDLATIAFAAFSAHDLPDGLEPNLEAQATYDPANFTFPFGTHVAVVEVDAETGHVELVQYAAVDDCGVQINPLVVEGQVHGGIVQGVAQALWEDATYDADGQLRTATLGDYLVPAASDTPSLRTATTVTPSPTNPLGVKGVGEAGTIAATPAVMNAVVDALAPLGVRDVAMPATPERIWRALN